jgi:hypothetical protein
MHEWLILYEICFREVHLRTGFRTVWATMSPFSIHYRWNLTDVGSKIQHGRHTHVIKQAQVHSICHHLINYLALIGIPKSGNATRRMIHSMWWVYIVTTLCFFVDQLAVQQFSETPGIVVILSSTTSIPGPLAAIQIQRVFIILHRLSSS